MNAQPTPAATEFIVLTGFLGTGKTTLLADFLTQPEAGDTAVIINEVGQVNVDGAVIAETGWALPVALLSNGCVCCTVGNDLLFTIEALVEGRRQSGQPPFGRIVLECSGLSRPAAVLRSLGDLAALQMKVKIVATLDATDPPLARSFDDAVAQLAAAQRIVLTKTEELSAPRRAEIVAQVLGLNPFATLVDLDDRRARARAAFQAGADDAAPCVPSPAFVGVATAHPRIEVLFAHFEQTPSWAELQDWIENLVGLCGERAGDRRARAAAHSRRGQPVQPAAARAARAGGQARAGDRRPRPGPAAGARRADGLRRQLHAQHAAALRAARAGQYAVVGRTPQ